MLRGKQGQKYKFVWQGCPEGLHGVGVLISAEFVDSVVSVIRVSERLMVVKMVIGRMLVNVISGYAPQVGQSDTEKDEFWCAVEKLMVLTSDNEVVLLGGDFNGHVGKSADGFEGVHGGHGYGARNREGERILEFADGADLLVCNTQFRKADNKLITYSSGGSSTTVDYIMVRRRDRANLRDAKVIPGEEVVSQHHLVVCDMRVKGARRAKRVKHQPRMKVWRLKEEAVRHLLREKLSMVEDKVVELETGWTSVKDTLLGAVGEVCGWARGPPRHSETWWWNDQVGKRIDEKRAKFKEWQKSKGTATEKDVRENYKAIKKAVKKEVARAQEAQRKLFGEHLDTEEGQKRVYRIAKQIAKERCDVTRVSCLKDEAGSIVVNPDGVKARWKRYMETLLNVENVWDGSVESDSVLGPAEEITEKEVEDAIRAIKSRKAGGPTGLVGDMLKAAGSWGVKRMTEVCNLVVKEGCIPVDWELSTLVPLYKGKGDPLDCGSYRAIKLLEHGMKVLERVLEKRIRKKVKIDDMQFGFMPGRGTTDATFIVRQLQEKYMEKRKKLYFGFVDLEKAFDRVPRKVVRWALRQLGVDEWLVRAVMAMYERARTVVRTKDGNSEEFEVKVGVHQGSVLSPLLFVVVMEVLAQSVKEGLPWELLYADDLVLIAESMEGLKEKMKKWKDCMEAKGLRVNIEKTKVMASGKGCGEVERTGKWPCAVCRKGVRANSIRCTKCTEWVHQKCSGVKGSLTSVMTTFECKVCIEGDADGENVELDLGNGVKFRDVKAFCYLGDMLNGEGGADSASVTRVRCAWKKFRELGGMLTRKEMSLKLKGKVYAACVRSTMIYGSETWAMNVEQQRRLERTEMRMVRWMCGVSLRERKTSDQLRRMMGIEPVVDVVKRSRLRWMGHVLRKNESDWVRKVMEINVEGSRARGRPRRTWLNIVEENMCARGLTREDAQDRRKWRKLSWGSQGQPPL